MTVTRRVMYDRIEERMEGRMKGGKDERREDTKEGRESVKDMNIARIDCRITNYGKHRILYRKEKVVSQKWRTL